MSKDIVIPSLGESISEVVISALLVDTGSFVQENQGILEIESEKVNQVVYAPSSGIIQWKIRVGDIVSVGTSVGIIKVEEEENIFYKKDVEESRNSSSENIREANSRKDLKDLHEEHCGEIIEFPGSVSPGVNKTFAPLKHPLSHESIKKEKKVVSSQDDLEEEKTPMSTLRKTMSKNLVKSLNESAMLTTFNEINMDVVIALRNKYKECLLEKTRIRLGFMPFFISAVTQALKEFPILNAYIDKDNNIVYRKYYNVGIAVSIDKGLVVPVIRNCDRFSLIELEQQLVDFANKARSGLISMEDLSQGGFTITNAGVFGSLFSTPIINPPQVGILGMHKIEKRPVVIDNEIKIAQMMYVALSYDHRIIDGKDAVSFLMRIKEIIENPIDLNIT